MRRFRPSALAVAVIAVLLGAFAVVAGTPKAAEAVSAWDFNPGLIISDDIFFNSSTMSPGDIQNFLNSKVSSCRSGYTCLKDYRENTHTISATPMCSQYDGAANESAATIIWKVAVTCGINPQVLLTTLQKEQGLVTDTWPTSGEYRSAMGAGCPDTAACDANYYGFFNQVHYGAYLFKRYTQPAGTGPGTDYSSRFDLMYPVGQTVNVGYNPSSSCGSQSVYIQNQATHVLYVYTPYVPNSAALDAGYGIGDGCSAYGNRNFFLYFSDWFGPTTYSIKGAFATYYNANKAALGAPTSNEASVNGGWVQSFRYGTLFTRPGTPVFQVRGYIRDSYNSVGAQGGKLGWPTGEEKNVNGGWVQTFEGGNYYSIGGTTVPVIGALGTYYRSLGEQAGVLGWPKGGESAVGGGWTQLFQNGTLTYSDATGPKKVMGAINTYYQAQGGAASYLGLALDEEKSLTNGGTSGWVQTFQRGVITFSGAAVKVQGDLGKAYVAAGGPASPYGFPTAEQKQVSGGWTQDLAGGTLFASSRGAYGVRSTLLAAYQALGGSSGAFGWPVESTREGSGRVGQSFERGTVVAPTPPAGLSATADSTVAVKGAIGDRYRAMGGLGSTLGWPTANERQSGSNWIQSFDNGSLYWTPSASYVVQGAIATYYAALGGETGRMGWPVGEQTAVGSGIQQQFANGYILSSAAGTFEVKGALLDYYRSAGSQSSWLGWPTGGEETVTGGWKQSFQGGKLFIQSGGRVLPVRGAIGTYYDTLNTQAGRLGWPIGGEESIAGGWRQQFQGGVILCSGTGTWFVGGDILANYLRAGGMTGRAGWPLESEQTVGGGWTQRFSGGTYYASGSGAGTWFVTGAIGAKYASAGAQTSALGWPIGNEAWTGSQWVQQFQGGQIVVAGGSANIVLR